MKELHPTQERLLNLLTANIESPLTMKELAEELDISSTSVIFHHIQQLEKKRYLKRNPHNPKDYTVLSEPEKQIIYLNQYGLAQCGANGSILDGNPVDRIPISSRLIKFPAHEAFAVIAKGDSMEPKIKEGDLVIARKTIMPQSGEIVVCVNELTAMIKKYIVGSNGAVILHSLNSEKHPPFVATLDGFKIEGVVKNVLQYE